MRDYLLGTTFDIKFTTRNRSSSTPDTLGGSPAVVAYPDNSGTPISTGITLTTNVNSVTGLNNIRVVATVGNGYAAGSNYALVISNGSVDGAVVIGEVVGEFSIEAQSVAVVAGDVLGDVAGDVLGNVVGTVQEVLDPVAIAPGGITAASFDAAAINPVAIDPAVYDANADAFLVRDLQGGSSVSSRNVQNALRPSRNRVQVTAGGVVTVYEEDDTTPAWAGVATRTAGANPLTEIDPA